MFDNISNTIFQSEKKKKKKTLKLAENYGNYSEINEKGRRNVVH